jgi:hypothetical protein
LRDNCDGDDDDDDDDWPGQFQFTYCAPGTSWMSRGTVPARFSAVS